MTTMTDRPDALAAVYIHWPIALAETAEGLLPEPRAVLQVLPGDTLVFTGPPATVTFPPGLTIPESGPVPGTFQVHREAQDGCYTYCIEARTEVPAAPHAGPQPVPRRRGLAAFTQATLTIGLPF